MSPARRLGPQALARAALTYLAEPGDPALGALLEVCEPAEVLAAIKAGTLSAIKAGTLSETAPDRPIARPARALEAALAAGGSACLGWRRTRASRTLSADSIRLVCPVIRNGPAGGGSPARQYALWLRGRADLPGLSARGSMWVSTGRHRVRRAHGRREAADLGERGWTVISGGAYGIDAARIAARWPPGLGPRGLGLRRRLRYRPATRNCSRTSRLAAWW